ncbi:MAG TPA: hypothetical protein VHC18_28650 [Amycolatopsis sp.]|nr:hypothetical protein [Amycolatopsis sp.]
MLSDTAEFERFEQDLRQTHARLLAAHAPFTRVRAVEPEPPSFDTGLCTRTEGLA